jgi:hypothetical protein
MIVLRILLVTGFCVFFVFALAAANAQMRR